MARSFIKLDLQIFFNRNNVVFDNMPWDLVQVVYSSFQYVHGFGQTLFVVDSNSKNLTRLDRGALCTDEFLITNIAHLIS